MRTSATERCRCGREIPAGCTLCIGCRLKDARHERDAARANYADAAETTMRLKRDLDEARAIARRLADEGRPMLGWTDGGLPLVRFIEAVRDFDALSWAKGDA